MQLLNIDYFQLYKHYYIKIINRIIQIKNFKFHKLDFLVNLIVIHIKTFQKSTIFFDFKKTDLISYNPELILQKIHFINNQLSLY